MCACTTNAERIQNPENSLLQAEPEPDLMGGLLGGDDEPAQPVQQGHAAGAEPPAPPAATPGGDLMGAWARVLSCKLVAALCPSRKHPPDANMSS